MEGVYYPNYEAMENYPGPYAHKILNPDRIVANTGQPNDQLGYQTMGKRILYPLKWYNTKKTLGVRPKPLYSPVDGSQINSNFATNNGHANELLYPYYAQDWGSYKCNRVNTINIRTLEACEHALQEYIKVCPSYHMGQGEKPRVIAQSEPYSSITTLDKEANDAGKLLSNITDNPEAARHFGIGSKDYSMLHNTIRVRPTMMNNAPPGCIVRANSTSLFFQFNTNLASTVNTDPYVSPLCIEGTMNEIGAINPLGVHGILNSGLSCFNNMPILGNLK